MLFFINTPRLILRDFRSSDWLAVHSYAKDPEVTQHMNWGPNSEDDTRKFIAMAMELAQDRPRLSYHLALVLRSSGQVMGGATLRMLTREPDSGELGYTLHPAIWGQGFGTEVAKAILDFGFGELQLRRIWATCRPENHGSRKILQKAGLRFEEYLQHEALVRGQKVDSLLWGMDRTQWLERPPSSSAERNMPVHEIGS